jgi:predicted O-methyltransferase YrrM
MALSVLLIRGLRCKRRISQIDLLGEGDRLRIMRQLTNRLFHTRIAKKAKQRLEMVTGWKILRQALALIYRLRRTDDSRQVVKLVSLLSKTDNLRQTIELVHLLNRTGNVHQATKLIRLLDRTGNFRQAIKLLRSLHQEGNFGFVFPFTPGHYSSPLPDTKEILSRSQVLFDRSMADLPGIDLREESQLKLLESFSYYYNDLPFPTQRGETTRYYYDNGWFGYGDAITLYSVLRHYEPHRVVEVGSGFSSAAMLDVNDLFLGRKVRFTFIEPNPKGGCRLLRLLTQEDEKEHTIVREQVQDVPLEVFRSLSANDILFVDSSHVGKVGSDVTYIFSYVLPELKPGVLVHFHDVYWPFEYPQEWFSWMAWNEAYFLRTFLQYNKAFEIVYFSSYIAQCHTDELRQKMPLCLEPFEYSLRGLEPGSSLWLRKTA